jgi:periplasmic mercuric ion binding protein
MKIILVILLFVSLQAIGISQSVQSVNTDTVEFSVYGNCGMCKSRIEKALKVDGIKSAEWNIKSKIVSVVYNKSKIEEEKLHQLIAGVGHDTDMVRSDDKTYSKLHKCCKYDRKLSENENSQNQQQSVNSHKE